MSKAVGIAGSNSELFEKIQADRKFLESVFDRVPGMIYIHDLVNDVNLYRSWTLKKMLGFEEDPVLKQGTGIRGLVHEDDLPTMRQAARDLQKLKDNEFVQFDYRMRHKDGDWIWFRSEEYVYERDADGRPIKCIGYATDITESVDQRQKLDELNRVNQFLLKAARILSKPELEYAEALQQFAKEVSLFLNAVCDIAMLDTANGIIRPEAMFHPDPEVRKTIGRIFESSTVLKGEGLVGRVITTGNELFIPSVPEAMRVNPRAVSPKIVPSSIMYVPLRGAERVLGSLNLTRTEGQEAFSDSQADQIRRLGDYVALFVENSLLKARQRQEVARRMEAEARLEREKQWAEFKLEISAVLADVSSSIDSILQEFVIRVSLFFDVVCDVHILDEENQVLNLVAIHYRDEKIHRIIEQQLVSRQLKVGQGMVGKAVATGKEVYVKELSEELRKKTEEAGIDVRILPASFAYIPLVSHKRILGTLDLTRLSGQPSLTEMELKQARDLAEHAAMIIENRVLQAEQKKEIRLRKKAEHKLERTHQVLERMEADTRAILNTIPIYIARVSKDYRYLFLNDTYNKMGIDPKKLEGRHIKEVLGEDGFSRLKGKFEMAASGDMVFYDYDGVMADGVHHYFSVALGPEMSELGEVVGFYVCSTDITPKVEAELAAKLTQDRMETLSLNSGDAFFFHDAAQNILDVNQVASDMLGYSREELLSMKAHHIDPRWNGRTYQNYLKELPTNLPQTFDTTVIKKDGNSIPVEVRFVKRKEGRKTYIQSLIRDRTEKREQELKLKQSENQLRLIFDNVEDFIATLSEDGTVESVNKTALGLRTEDVVGSSVFDWYPDSEVQASVRTGFELLRTTGKGFEVETTSYTGPDGSVRTYYNKYLAKFQDGKFFKAILIIRDITEEKNKERSEMNAVLRGQEQERKRLGAELHDGIGQILSAIGLLVSQIREDEAVFNSKKLSDQLEKLNTNLQSAIREVRGISHDLMPEVLESFGLKEAVKQICASLQDRSGIQVKFDHADLEPRYNSLIEMNLYRITQELVNNIQKHSNCKRVFVSLMDHGDSLNLMVEDDGKGFDRSQDVNGIGLKNIRSRVALMGGQIDIESALDSGTLINIEVPKML
ncbi:MAG: PAS domain S-box protein [Flavobacteriales bacterium]|nr:PAS domain S-box protein [Flavobacteriales bacterium]